MRSNRSVRRGDIGRSVGKEKKNAKHRGGFCKIPNWLLDLKHGEKHGAHAEFLIHVLSQKCWGNRRVLYCDSRGCRHTIQLKPGQAYLPLRKVARDLERAGLTHKKVRLYENLAREWGLLIRLSRPGINAGFVYEVHPEILLKEGTPCADYFCLKIQEINSDKLSKRAHHNFEKDTDHKEDNSNSVSKERESLIERGESREKSRNDGGLDFQKFGADILGKKNIEKHQAAFEQMKISFRTLGDIPFSDYISFCGQIAVSCKLNCVEAMLSEDTLGALNLISEFDAWRQAKTEQGKELLPYLGPGLIFDWAVKSKKIEILTDGRQSKKEKSHEH